jgi:choline dehydrogenase
MLGDQHDVDMIVAGLKMARKVLGTDAFRSIIEEERTPGANFESDPELEAYVRSSASPSYHACGSVKMGVDSAAVVSPELRVIGTENVRVADSSIIPQIPSGNINAISMLIGEKASDFILGK